MMGNSLEAELGLGLYVQLLGKIHWFGSSFLIYIISLLSFLPPLLSPAPSASSSSAHT